MDIPLKVMEQGLFCTSGNFFIDAWKPSPICIVTHAHGDHAYWGHDLYIGSPETVKIMQHRLGKDIPCQILEYDQKIKLGKSWVSLHPAGHILGSSQIRIEDSKRVTVISGDYKRAPDPTCKLFEVVECDIFVTESTFALPIYQWPKNEIIETQIYEWWQENAKNEHPSILFCYALGKAQRVMSMLGRKTDKGVHLHGAVYSLSKLYHEMGIEMIPFAPVSESAKGTSFKQDLIIAPPSAMGSPWMKRFPSFRTAFASGWMEVRGTRRRKALDRGFVLSDHADWTDLVKTIEETKAKIVLTTHGNSAILAQYLREEMALDARELKGLEANFEEED
ncbi:MAG TPA: ligase-associated DNA damage response exonuclease [Parachlamydiaceae bacterium]|nr:ligase-associated DNA damage response exonuclease [Parachlamydiaceae bacterium]